MGKREVSLPEVFRIFARRKWFIISSVLFFLLAAFIYNLIKDPVYEASVLLKKEMNLGDQFGEDRIENMLALRSQDELETEMQLVKTRSVIDDVIKELALNILITRVIEQDGTVTPIELPVTEYNHNLISGMYSESFPKINRLYAGINSKPGNYIIKYDEDGKTSIIDDSKNKIGNEVITFPIDTVDEWEIIIDWSEKLPGEIHFAVLDYDELFKDISDNIFTDKKIKTSIFEVGVRSSFPNTTKQIANCLVEKFRESRMSLQKENIKYTYNFIDERLTEVAENLRTSESELSGFKADAQIVEINEQSKNLISFLSNLESEKLKNNLELELYENKLNNINDQLLSSGFVDQTYLTPEQYQNTSSPFANLLNELANLELRKLELLQRRTDIHPDVVLVSDQIERVEIELRKYNKNTLNAYSILASSLSEKQNLLDSLITKYSLKIEDMPAQEAKLADLIRKKDAYEKMYTLLLDKREEMRVAELSRMQDIVVLDPAVDPVKPVAPRKTLNLLFAAIFGIVFGFFAVLVVQSTDKKITSIKDLESESSFQILTAIPPFDKKIIEQINTTESVKNRFITMMDEQYKYKEAYRKLETKLASKIKELPKKIMITSCEEDAGKTTTATNLAITIAQSGKKVLLVDCDIKNPSIGDKFGLPKYSSGLLDYLTEQTDIPSIYKPVKLTSSSTLLVNLDILPTGIFTNVSGEVLASDRMKKLLTSLEYYDFVIFDTAPITKLSDALSLGRIIKDTILVIREGQTIKESISWAIAELKTSDIRFQGLVVNDCNIKHSNFKYHYGYMNN